MFKMRNDYQHQNDTSMLNGALWGLVGGAYAKRYGCIGGFLRIVLYAIIGILVYAFLLKPAVNFASTHYDYRTGWHAEPVQERVIDSTPDPVEQVTPTYEDEQYNYNMQDAQQDVYDSLNKDANNQ